MSKIQDESLSDYQIRDLNDEINKLMREKHMWEVQIRNLGGPNYMRGGRVVDEDGKEIPGGGKGYRYVQPRSALGRGEDGCGERWLTLAAQQVFRTRTRTARRQGAVRGGSRAAATARQGGRADASGAAQARRCVVLRLQPGRGGRNTAGVREAKGGGGLQPLLGAAGRPRWSRGCCGQRPAGSKQQRRRLAGVAGRFGRWCRLGFAYAGRGARRAR